MKDEHKLLAPDSPDTWLHRFLAGAAHADTAFVTPAGHALTWSQFRFVYPRYREVPEEWRPPTHSLDALVFHFGAYEVAIPAAQLGLELGRISDFLNQRDRLTGAWRTALPMEAQILVERMAAVHSKMEVVAATCAYDREPLQDLLAIPGVRLERARARLSEVASGLLDEWPVPQGDVEQKVRADSDMRRKSRAARKREYEHADGMQDFDWDDTASRATLLNALNRYPSLKGLYDAVPPEFQDDLEAVRQMMFIEAVRRKYTTRERLRLARIFVRSEGKGEDQPQNDADWPWVGLAHRLGQYRTAWCLAIRTLDGQWRDGGVHYPPYGSGNPLYPVRRSIILQTLAELAKGAYHPYWTPIFTMWWADYDAGIDRRKTARAPDMDRPLEARPGEETDDALLERVRGSRPSFRDDDR